MERALPIPSYHNDALEAGKGWKKSEDSVQYKSVWTALFEADFSQALYVKTRSLNQK